MALQARDICTAALQEFGGIGATDAPSNEDATFVLGKLNRLLDTWNADRGAVYAAAFATYNLTPNLSPHTIGPTGTFVVGQRPVSIDDAGLVLNNVTPNVRLPIRIRTDQWWAAQTVKSLATDVPTDLYYEADWPNGSLFFWPVPDLNYQVELRTRIVLAQLGLNDAFSLPPGYWDAITLTLAETLVDAYGKQMPGSLPARAAKARMLIQSNNQQTVPMTPGLPRGSGRTRPYYNRYTGDIVK